MKRRFALEVTEMKLLVLLGLVSCAMAHKCCPPKQFEAIMGQIGGSCMHAEVGDTTFAFGGDIHYDYNRKMVAATESGTSGGQEFHLNVIQDFNKNKQFLIMQGTCKISVLPGSIDDTCLPDTAVFGGTFAYGLDGFQGDLYYLSGEQMGVNVSAYIVVTKNECLPFSQSVFLSQPAADTIAVMGYTNTTLGIKDPTVFEIPKICRHDEVMSLKAMGDLVSNRMKWVMSSFGAR